MTWDRYTSKTTGFKVQVLKEGNFTSRSYCDDVDATDVYTSKPPVAMIELDPIVQFVNTNVAWDVSNSRHPTGTIDTYDIDFGDGIIADVTSAAWSGAKTGNVQYTVPGYWTVTCTVTDTLGIISTPAKVQVHIIDELDGLGYFYTVTTDAGVFIVDDTGATAINSGLTGGWLLVRSLRLHPMFSSLPQALQHLWIATSSGVGYSADGGTSWNKITRSEMGEPNDATTEEAGDLDCIDIAFNPTDWKEIAVYRENPGGPLWVYVTSDYGTTWTNHIVQAN